ncbi:MAG TPA: peptidoglycan-associated lipoprotein Pal [Burkholderiaceae bacterium]|nr:peptidoglycan-associated lipoprotein Pal [Burkholderiaceae bacterium]
MHDKTIRAGAVLCLAAAMLLGGCASGVKLDEPAPVETLTPSGSAAGAAGAGAGSSATTQSKVTTVDLSKTGDAAANGLQKVIYFDFDSFVVKDEYRVTVESYAKLLNADRKKRLMLEGHADERGGREYNLALGQKRAEAVQKAILLLGASAGQMEAVSYGEERPAVTGSDEAALAKNRRVELILR